MSQSIPVVFIIFNRPDLTARVFERIRAARPEILHVIADGPRFDAPEDAKLVEATRAIIRHDWEGALFTDYSEEKRIHSGLCRVFETHERAIVLEDDCLPHSSFFTFCAAMLEKYAGEEEVMHVSGANFVPARKFRHAYAFTRYPTPWGWASWRRAWERIDLEMNGFFDDAGSILARSGISRKAGRKVIKRLRKVANEELDSWAYPWLAAQLRCGGLSVTPRANLVSNIGFDGRSTHTSNPNSPFANKVCEDAFLNYTEPAGISLDPRVNRAVFDLFFGGGHRRLRRWDRLLNRLGLSAPEAATETTNLPG